MERSVLNTLSRALLYEGYLLYPYRRSSIKNQRRFTFGGLAPRYASKERAEPYTSGCQLLVEGGEALTLCASARFLHPLRQGQRKEEEAEEREVLLPPVRLIDLPMSYGFSFPAKTEGAFEQPEISGEVRISAQQRAEALWRILIQIENHSPISKNSVLPALLSAHLVLETDGAFVSQLDPPPHLATEVEACESQGLWPFLLGKPGARDLVLCSPIILYDYPQIAPESPGDLFDGTEIDEILTLRILTMTEEEKREAGATNEKIRKLLARTESLSEEDLFLLHGVIRERSAPKPHLKPGDRVRLRPRHRADIFDIALTGKSATIISIEEDAEGLFYFTVIIDDDPGRDLGEEGKPGHRFFFWPDEVEPLSQNEQEAL